MLLFSALARRDLDTHTCTILYKIYNLEVQLETLNTFTALFGPAV